MKIINSSVDEQGAHAGLEFNASLETVLNFKTLVKLLNCCWEWEECLEKFGIFCYIHLMEVY